MRDKEIIGCISGALTGIHAYFTYHEKKAKWTVIAFDNGTRVEYRVRFFSIANHEQGNDGQKKVIEFQRRQGSAVHFHQSYSNVVNGLRRCGALHEIVTNQSVLPDAAFLSASLPPSSAADVLSGLNTMVCSAVNARWIDARKEAVEGLTHLSVQPHNRRALLLQTECVTAMVKLLLTNDEPSTLNGYIQRCAVTVLADLFTHSDEVNVSSADLAPHLAAVSAPVVLATVVQMTVGSTAISAEQHTDTQTRRECCRMLLAIIALSNSTAAVSEAVRGNAAIAAQMVSIGEGYAVDPCLSELVRRLQSVIQPN